MIDSSVTESEYPPESFITFSTSSFLGGEPTAIPPATVGDILDLSQGVWDAIGFTFNAWIQ